MNKRTSKISLAVLIALSQLAASQLAQADSVHSWGNWDGAPPASKKDSTVASNATNSSTNNIATLLDRTPTAGSLAEESTWIGYAVTYVSSNENVDSGNKVSVFQITPTVRPDELLGSDPDRRSKDSGLGGSIKVSSDTPEFNFSFDSANNFSSEGDSSNTYSYMAFNSDQEGTFYATSNSSSLTNGINKYNSTYISTGGDRINGDSDEQDGQYLAYLYVSSGSSSYSEANPESSQYNYVGAGGIMGKVMPLADIAAQTRLGANYTFNGYSRNGGEVSINVNFGAANWQGNWGAGYANNAFNASGTISGATLNSNSVVAAGNTDFSSPYHVQGGSVKGTLIGVFNAGASSSAGVIGATQLNVGAIGTTATQVNDVFKASLNGRFED